MKKITTDMFINLAINKHGNIFDYSKSFYINSGQKIEIICKQHGPFWQLPKNHLSYFTGCQSCINDAKSDRYRMPLDIFIQKSNKKHNNKFDYSLVEYKALYQKIKIICPIHDIFEQTASEHIHGKGCRYCANRGAIEKKEYIKRFQQTYGDRYDYSRFEYLGANKKSIFICKAHGEFKQLPYSHLAGHDCPKCTKHERIDLSVFLQRVIKIHNNLYDYSLIQVIKGNQQYINIICRKHGIFKQQVSMHLSGQGCSKCKASHGEIKIRNFLLKNNINFIEQKRFESCRSIRPLPFDFYIEQYNILIEYDGSHHFGISTNTFKHNFEKIKKHDEIKNKWCCDNNMKLIRVKYTENIYDALNNLLIKVNSL